MSQHLSPVWLAAPRTPAQVLSTYQRLAPPSGRPSRFYQDGVTYLGAIATHYERHPTAPPCTVATVYATVLHHEPGVVLDCLCHDAHVAPLVRPLVRPLVNCSPLAARQIRRALASLTFTLQPQAPALPAGACQVVSAYLSVATLRAHHAPEASHL